jgi:hypothetical protein
MTMRNTGMWLVLLSAFAWPGCAPRGADEEAVPEAHRQTELARTLEASGDKREAAHEYTIVAEHFPGTSYQAIAARRAGLLYADPDNPGRSDSLAVYWLLQYLQLSIPQPEREEVEICLKLIEQSGLLRSTLVRLAAAQDSLATVLKRQASGSSALSWRIGELEGELERTKSELKRLKEIDARARSRRKP